MKLKHVILLVLICHQIRVSAQQMVVMESVYLKTNDTILVYKPTLYNIESKYPTVFLLHGHSGNYKSWSSLTNLQTLSDQYNFIIICPDGLKKSWYMNSPKPDSVQYEDFFFKELVPKINRDFKTDTKRFFITGASMGGFGAIHLFLSHPDVFLSAGSTSGVLNLRHSGFKKTTLSYLLGTYSEDNQAFDSYSPINRLKTIKTLNKHLIFDCGTEDYLYKANNQFRQKCDELKIRATYTTQPGAHTGGYWSKSILQHMKFFDELSRTQVQ